MLKKITYILLFIFLVSCANTFDSVKRGLTGAKKSSADEFLVKKKDPLILPPDFEKLPKPGEQRADQESITSFEKSLTKVSSDQEFSSSTGSTEESILHKIRKK